MKKLLVAGIAVTALGVVPAIAADMNVPSSSDPLADFPIVYQIPPVRVFTWTGCYLGVHAGGASVDNQFNGQFLDPVIPSTSGAPTVGAISSNGINVGTAGVLGGAQAGCDFQFAKHWVAGVSADAAGANIQGSTAQTAPVTTPVNSSGSLNAQTNFIATFTGRFGYSMGGGLFYVKGGGAYEQSSYSFVGTVSSTVNQPFNFGASTDSRFGWTIGIGTEWMVYGGLSVIGEYNYLDFGPRTVTFSDPAMGSYNFNVTQHFNEFKLGVNYRFNVEADPYRNN